MQGTCTPPSVPRSLAASLGGPGTGMPKCMLPEGPSSRPLHVCGLVRGAWLRAHATPVVWISEGPVQSLQVKTFQWDECHLGIISVRSSEQSSSLVPRGEGPEEQNEDSLRPRVTVLSVFSVQSGKQAHGPHADSPALGRAPGFAWLRGQMSQALCTVPVLAVPEGQLSLMCEEEVLSERQTCSPPRGWLCPSAAQAAEAPRHSVMNQCRHVPVPACHCHAFTSVSEACVHGQPVGRGSRATTEERARVLKQIPV